MSDDVRRSSWETMLRNLAAEAVLTDAALYAAGHRRLTVEHGEPTSPPTPPSSCTASSSKVNAVVDAAGHVGGTLLLGRLTSLTWTFPSTDVPARNLVIAARAVADRLNPGGWVITADEHR